MKKGKVCNFCGIKQNYKNKCDTHPICHWMFKMIAPPQTHIIGWANVLIAPQSHSVYREINMQMIVYWRLEKVFSQK